MFDSTPGATIHYTTDGTDPTADSPIYAPFNSKKRKPTGITITGNGQHTVKAIAVAPGYAQSAITTAKYTIR